ncbi:amidohydrolase family protein [Adhaeribacter rhizoryzae]|nr:amidohydrolase family protein [Adhaeribacter rhizoryzae]
MRFYLVKAGNTLLYVVIMAGLLTLAGCATPGPPANQEKYYTLDDFSSVPKFDTHVHLNTTDPSLLEQAQRDNFRLLTINVNAPHYPTITQQQELALQHRKNFSDRLAYATTFSVQNWGAAHWAEESLAYLKSALAQGAIGVKIWKNIGMELKDENGAFVMINDPRFKPILDYLEQNKIPVIGHLGEPKNCWLPLAEMTVNNNRNYYAQNPRYHMYLHPEAPSYEEHIRARDQVLAMHPRLPFTGAHLGSLEWSVDELAKRLDKYPNLAVDISARMAHLQYQAQTDWQKVRNFIIKYQDRLVYATDIAVDTKEAPAKVKERAHATWLRDWRFLVTADTMTNPNVNGEFKSLHLPKTTINKIYHKNALKMFPGLAKLDKSGSKKK